MTYTPPADCHLKQWFRFQVASTDLTARHLPRLNPERAEKIRNGTSVSAVLIVDSQYKTRQ